MIKFSSPVLLVVSLFIVLVLNSCTVQRKMLIEDKALLLNEMVLVNGVEQALIIRGENINNPVLVHIHGGPGYPLFPYIKDFKPLEKYFTIVYWEQRGTAKSLNSKVNKEAMVTDTLLSDLNQVIAFSKQKLNKEKVFLWGHSWGSNLGMLYIHEHPENVLAYIGTGQSVNLIENERLCYQFAYKKAKEARNEKALALLQKVDTLDYALDDALAVRRWVYTYGGIVHKVNNEKAYVNFDIVKDVFATPEYRFSDKWRILFRSKYSGKNLWDDMMQINLFKQVEEVNVPVYFFLGRYDHIVSSKLAAKYFNRLKAKKGKTLVWFESSAHRPHTEEPKRFLTEILKVEEAILAQQ